MPTIQIPPGVTPPDSVMSSARRTVDRFEGFIENDDPRNEVDSISLSPALAGGGWDLDFQWHDCERAPYGWEVSMDANGVIQNESMSWDALDEEEEEAREHEAEEEERGGGGE